VIFQTSFGVNIRPWLVVMFILSCITTISFNLYFNQVPCTSKNHRQTLTADNGGSRIVISGKMNAECYLFQHLKALSQKLNIRKCLAEIVNAECYQTDNQLHLVGEEVNAHA